ncbi:MAG: PAC2 family protein [Candidatus Hermodarchaeota archaeon]|nr:PAC2 family protein [Candidatus Hermodarchaeota archaeon]
MIEIIWLQEVTNLRAPIALVGMPGIASVGKLAIEVLIRSLEAEPLIQLLSDDFPPHVMINEDGMMKIPECQIFLHRSKELKHDILMVSGDFQPSTSQGIYEFSDRIAETFKKLGVTKVVATGAYVPGEYPEAPKVFVSSTGSEFQEFFTELDYVVPMSDGVINGANGVIPAWAHLKYGIDGVCLLAETVPLLRLDPRASKLIVEVLNNRFNIQADVSELEQKIEEMKGIFEQVRDHLLQQRGQQEPRDESESASYIG